MNKDPNYFTLWIPDDAVFNTGSVILDQIDTPEGFDDNFSYFESRFGDNYFYLHRDKVEKLRDELNKMLGE